MRMSWNEKSLNHVRAARRRPRTRELPILLSALLSSASIATLVLIPQQAQAQAIWQPITNNYNVGANWNTSLAPIGAGQTATFGAAGITAINVSSAVAPDSWVFNSSSSNYSFTGSAVNFGAGLTDTSSANISIANSLGGPGTVLLSTTGTLTLTGANNYTGGTAISAGTLQLSGAGTLGASSNFLHMTNGAVHLVPTTQTVNGDVAMSGG